MFSPKGTADAGWLVCEGGTFVQATYPALYAYLGSTTLPNYTDRVLRGAGTLAGDAYTTQDDEVGAHHHIQGFSVNSTLVAGARYGVTTGLTVTTSSESDLQSASDVTTNGANTSTTGGAETRVKSAVGKFVIKAH